MSSDITLGVAVTAIYLAAGSLYVATYLRFTHGQTLSGDKTATRLLESRGLREYWPLVLIVLLIFVGWIALFIVDMGRLLYNTAFASRQTGE